MMGRLKADTRAAVSPYSRQHLGRMYSSFEHANATRFRNETCRSARAEPSAID
jgi:hypothetical protein